jgi:hypothetical protein
MCYSEEQYKKLLYNFELLSNVIRAKSTTKQFKADLSRLEEIIKKRIPEIWKGNAPEDIFELYSDFKAEYERFRDFILYDKLIGKNIVALGGGFSSGKSSFLNGLMGRSVLPSDIDPSTSVPTFIVKGNQHEVLGINVFDSKVKMQPKDIKKVSYGFGEIENDNNEKITGAVTLGHILESIFFSTTLHAYDNIAFLDTPGYSKADSEKYSVKTDEQIARGQLNSSNYILWFIPAEAGNIKDADIEFIKTLRKDIPKLFIVSKSDKRRLPDLTNIVDKIKETLDLKKIDYVDVMVFSNKIEQIAEKESVKLINNDLKRIRAQLEKWNQQKYQSNFAKNFKRLFIRLKEYYENEIDEKSFDVERLNWSLMSLSKFLDDKEILNRLQGMVNEKNRDVVELKNINQKLKDLQTEFFTEIKIIADIVGIEMPEPSEIDLITEDIRNPLQIFEEYNKKNGIIIEDGLSDLLQEEFSDIKPVINVSPGGSEYKKELLSILLDNCNVAPKDIRINNILSKKLTQ